MSDWYWVAIIGTAFLGLIGLAELSRIRLGAEVEWTRKLVHFAGGMICMTFPFVLRSHWTVLILAVSMAALFVVTRQAGWLPSIHAVERKSRGSEYYPVVIYVLFLLAADKPWMYVICVLVLAVADAAAAIIGTRFGRITFRVEDETKSLEGSTAFFVATFVVVLIPMMWFRPEFDQIQFAYWHYLFAAILIGLLVSCFEAVSRHGRDNLFIPLGTLLVLTKTLQTDIWDVGFQIVSFVAILLIILVLSRISNSFHAGGAIVFCLASYGCWAMGSFDWALPFFIGYALYVAATLWVVLPWKLTIRPVVYNVVPPFLILAIGNLALNQGYSEITRFCFGPFLAACGVALSLAITNAVNWQSRKKQWNTYLTGALVGLLCFSLLVLPSAVRLEMFVWQTLALLAITVVVYSMLGSKTIEAVPPPAAPFRWYAVRVMTTLLAAALIAVLQSLGLATIWEV